MVPFFFFFFYSFSFFPVRMRGMAVGGRVEGIREEARVEGIVVVERGWVSASDSAITSR